MRYRRSEIERWIEDIEQRTLERARTVQRRLAADTMLSETLLSMPDSRERLFAALLTGDFELLRRPQFEPPWVSWVENQRPYSWLTTHEQILVDLVPPDPDPQRPSIRLAFDKKYHCSSSQFVSLIERMPDSIRINVRNDSIGDYTDDQVIDAMGSILSMSERYPDSFYRLRPIRSIAFPLLGVDFTQMEERARELCRGYPALFEKLPRGADPQLFALTRAEGFPPPRQMEARLAYYLAARQLWPDPADGAGDERLEEWLAGALQRGTTLDFKFDDLHQLTDNIARLYTAHHLFTAQLTGALGGTYGWRPREFDYACQIHDRVIPPTYDDGRQLSIASWFFALQAGMVVRPGEADAIDEILPMHRLPNDIEWRSFLDRVKLNRHKFRERLGQLSELAGVAPGAASLDGDDANEVEQIVKRLDKIARSGFDTRKIGAAGFGLGGIGAKLAGMDLTDILAVVNLCYSMAKSVPMLEKHCNKFERFTGSLCKKRAQRTALSGALSDFDLPYRS